MIRHLSPTHTHTDPRAALRLSRVYIRRRFLLVQNFVDIVLLRENHEDVSARNLWRSYSDRQKVRWRARRDHQTEGFGHQIYRASTQKVKLFYFYFKRFLTVSLFLHGSIDMSHKLTTPQLFRCYRWAAFRQVVDDTDKSVRAILSGDQNAKFLQHIGGAYYVSVNSGYHCVNLRKWFQPLYSAGDNKPTKKGVSLRLDEWSSLCDLVDVINQTYTSLYSALLVITGTIT